MGTTLMNTFRLAALAVTHPVITTRAIFSGGFSQGLGNMVVGAAAELALTRNYLHPGLTLPANTNPFRNALSPLGVDAARVALGVARSWFDVPPESWVRRPLVQWLETADVDQAAAVFHQLDIPYAQRVLARLSIDGVAAILNSDKISAKKAAAILGAGCKWEQNGSRTTLRDGKWAVAVLSSEQMRVARAAAILEPEDRGWFSAGQASTLLALLPSARAIDILESDQISPWGAGAILGESLGWWKEQYTVMGERRGSVVRGPFIEMGREEVGRPAGLMRVSRGQVAGPRSLAETWAVSVLSSERMSAARAAAILNPGDTGWFSKSSTHRLLAALTPKRKAEIKRALRR